MNEANYNMLSTKSKIGISIEAKDTAKRKIDSSPKVYAGKLSKMTKANSFTVLDEVFYIAKKDYTGKASKIYHVYRVSDMRLVCPSVLDKEDTIKMVMDKYIDYM